MGDADVLIIVPTRDRPESAVRLIGAWERAGSCSDLMFCVDTDDPQLAAYQHLQAHLPAGRRRARWKFGPRDSLAGWTNHVARQEYGSYRALMSMGDDHVPLTPGFDRLLLDAAMSTGGGFAYGDDGLQHDNLPTAVLITSNIIKALGWMCLPGCRHMYIDAVWKHLAETARCRHYLPDVQIRHFHHVARLAGKDQTYIDGEASWGSDELAFRAWQSDSAGPSRQSIDAQTVREAIK